MEVLRTVGVIEALTRLGTQRLAVCPEPLGSIADDAQAPLLFRHQASLLALRESLAELRVAVHLMPTEPRDDALTLQQREAQPLRLTPRAPPPRPLGSRVPASRLGRPSAVRTGRHLSPRDAQHPDRTAEATRGHRGDASQALLTRGCHIHHGQLPVFSAMKEDSPWNTQCSKVHASKGYIPSQRVK
jgi:hypothetical protein